jgi:hypothetical protein
VHGVPASEGKQRVRDHDERALSASVLPAQVLQRRTKRAKKKAPLDAYIEELMEDPARLPASVPAEHFQISSLQPSSLLTYLPSLPLDLAVHLLSLLPPSVPLNQPQLGVRGFAGRTILHWCCRYGNAELARHLLASYPPSALPPGAATKDGTNAAHLACYSLSVPCLRVLVEALGAEEARGMVSATNEFSCDGALWAAQGSRLRRQGGAELSAGEVDGMIRETLEFLAVELKVPLTAKNTNGHSVYHKLAQRNHPGAIEFLRDSGVEIKIERDGGGWWPSDLAEMEGWERCVRIMREMERDAREEEEEERRGVAGRAGGGDVKLAKAGSGGIDVNELD